MLVELIDAERGSGLLGVADQHADASNPHGQRSQHGLLEKVGEMGVVDLLATLVDFERLVVDVALHLEKILERLHGRVPLGLVGLLDVVEHDLGTAHHQVVHEKTRFAALDKSTVAEEICHAVQADIGSIEVVSNRVAFVVRLE